MILRPIKNQTFSKSRSIVIVNLRVRIKSFIRIQRKIFYSIQDISLKWILHHYFNSIKWYHHLTLWLDMGAIGQAPIWNTILGWIFTSTVLFRSMSIDKLWYCESIKAWTHIQSEPRTNSNKPRTRRLPLFWYF